MSLQAVLTNWDQMAVSEPGTQVVSEAALLATVRGPQPPGPSPAYRHHTLGVGAHGHPGKATLPQEAPAE